MKNRILALGSIALLVVLLLVSACTSANSNSPTTKATITGPTTTTTGTLPPSRQPSESSTPTLSPTLSPGASPVLPATSPSSPTSGIASTTPSSSVVSPTVTPATPLPTASPGATSQEIFGQVMSLGADKNSFIIQKDDGTQVTVNVSSNTRYFIENIDQNTLSQLTSGLQNMMGADNGAWSGFSPDASATPGPSDKDNNIHDNMFGGMTQNVQLGSFGDIALGDLVLVKGSSTANSGQVVFIIKFTGNLKFAQGTVSSVSANSIAINPDSGSALNLNSNAQSKVMLVGELLIQGGERISCLYDSSNNAFLLALVRVATGAPASPAASPSASPTASATP
jgi:hypothetical protein